MWYAAVVWWQTLKQATAVHCLILLISQIESNICNVAQTEMVRLSEYVFSSNYRASWICSSCNIKRICDNLIMSHISQMPCVAIR